MSTPAVAGLSWETVCVEMGPFDSEAVVAVLRRAGARFAFVFGSRARGDFTTDSDVDVAAYFGVDAPQAFEVLVPRGVDLLILDRAPLELAGRVAMEGLMLFDDTSGECVTWIASTRKIYADERYRFERSHREFAEGILARG